MNHLRCLGRLPPDLIGGAMNGPAKSCHAFSTCRLLLFRHRASLFGDGCNFKPVNVCVFAPATIVVIVFTRFRLLAVLFHGILLGAIVAALHARDLGIYAPLILVAAAGSNAGPKTRKARSRLPGPNSGLAMLKRRDSFSP